MCGGHIYQFKEGNWYKISFISVSGHVVRFGKYKGKVTEGSIVVCVRNKVGAYCQCVLTIKRSSWLKNPFFNDYFYTATELRKVKLKRLGLYD